MNVKTLKSWTLQSFALRGNGGAQVYEGYEVKKKKGENYAVVYFAGKSFFIYEVFIWEKNKILAGLYYLCVCR